MFVRRHLAHWAQEQELQLDEASWDRLEALGELWLRYGRSLNLTGDPSEEGLSRQIQDGLATLLCVERGGALARDDIRWLDVGSGGGFPSLIIAATCPSVSLTLVEPRQKRAGFLELASRAIKTSSTRVIRLHIDPKTWRETAATGVFGSERSGFWIASARAVWSPYEWLLRGREWVEQGGFVVVHRGSEPEDALGSDPVERVRLGRGSVELHRAR